MFVIPSGHGRRCRQYPLWDMYLKDDWATREINFEHVLRFMDDDVGEALEAVPLDMDVYMDICC